MSKQLIAFCFFIFIALFSCISEDSQKTNYDIKDGMLFSKILKKWIKFQPDLIKNNKNAIETLKFEGEILEIFPAASYWSGAAPAFQGVLYSVNHVFSGNINSKSIVMYHAITPTIYCNYRRAELTPAIFRIGNHMYIESKNIYKGYYIVDDNAYSVRIIKMTK